MSGDEGAEHGNELGDDFIDANGNLDFGAAIRAERAPLGQKLSIYIPNKKRKKNLHAKAEEIINIETEIETAMNLLVRMNGGVTLLAPSDGVWHDPELGEYRNEMLKDDVERTAIVYSFIRDPESFKKKLTELRAFLHNFGHKHDQGEVMVELSGEEVVEEKENGEKRTAAYSRAYVVKPPYDVKLG